MNRLEEDFVGSGWSSWDDLLVLVGGWDGAGMETGSRLWTLTCCFTIIRIKIGIRISRVESRRDEA